MVDIATIKRASRSESKSTPPAHCIPMSRNCAGGDCGGGTGMNILTVFGTRPEAIKMAPLVKALKDEPSIRSLVCVTGQHREMLKQVLQLFEIVPDFDLSLMIPNQTLNALSARALGGLDEVLG